MFSARREVEHEPAPLPVLGDVAEARVERVAHACAVMSSPSIVIVPAFGDRRPGDRVDQLGLAVSVDARDADDLAGADLERDAAHLLDPAVVHDLQVLDHEQRLAGLGGDLVDAQQYLPADHQPGEALLGRARRGQRVDLLPAPQDGDPVGDVGHLVQLVADEDDRLALLGEAADDREQLLRLLRRQNRRRLVEDEDVGSAVERLQDLDALLLADRDVVHERARVDGQAEAAGDVAHALLGRRVVEQDAVVRRLGREHDVLGDRHHRDQHEVLVHHADPVLDRRARRAELGLLAVDQDLALVRVVEAVEDVHQRRLAGAVLAEERVHLALAQVEVDVVVRNDAGEALRDPTKLENAPLVHPGRFYGAGFPVAASSRSRGPTPRHPCACARR